MTLTVLEDRRCACGCGVAISARYPNGKPSYARYVLGHQQRGRTQPVSVRTAVSRSRQEQFRQRYADGRDCPDCDRRLDLEAFWVGGKWREVCASCHQKRVRKRYAMTHYGVTAEEYDRLIEATHCALCGCEAAESERALLFIDHDHVTGRVREMLCSACNKGLGSFRDDPGVLRRAADYIERHRGVLV